MKIFLTIKSHQNKGLLAVQLGVMFCLPFLYKDAVSDDLNSILIQQKVIAKQTNSVSQEGEFL